MVTRSHTYRTTRIIMSNTTQLLSFESFARELTDASSILPDDAIAGYIMQNKMQPIMLYCYRIAAYAAQDIRSTHKAPEATDDTDYIDAVQECILHTPSFVRNWSKNPKHKFSTYVNVACKNIIKDYLWTLARGGTGTNNTFAATVEQLPDVLQEDLVGEYENDFDDADIAYEYPPQGYRDPLEELIAAEDEDRAMRALMRPAATPEATRVRNIRVKRTLGLNGAKHHE